MTETVDSRREDVIEPVSAILTTALPWLSQVALSALESTATKQIGIVTGKASRRLQLRLNLAPGLDEPSRRLAWVTYVQLVTRISVVPLPDDHGFDREVLTSMYTLFGRLRDELEQVGSASAAKGDRDGTPIGVAVAVVLNVVLRPFLSYWHPHLELYEATRPPGMSKLEHQQRWERHGEFREQLALLQDGLRRFANALEQLLQIDAVASLQELGPIPEIR